MEMNEIESFLPDWVSPPGETIVDILNERRIPIAEFSKRLGRSLEDVEKIISGKYRLTSSIACQLEQELGATAKFWEVRESQYRKDLLQLKSKSLTNIEKQWVKDFPTNDMANFGWINPGKTVAEKLSEILDFFEVDDIPHWERRYQQVLSSVSFRKSPTFDAHDGATIAWLRQGERIAEEMNCKPWSAESLSESLRELRSLTKESEPSKFVPRVQEICAASGVAVVIARAPSGCRASGATRFISSDRALVLLSFRYLSDDHFWFSFFHEIAHILLHKRTDIFIEGKDMHISEEEAQADAFSEQILIPSEYFEEMMALTAEYRPILRFAKRLGISSGIVVGQLQHYGRLKRSQMNKLKVRYTWSD